MRTYKDLSRAVLEILLVNDISYSEMHGAGVALVSGVWFLLSPDALGLSNLLHPGVVGLLLAVIGAMQIAALAYDLFSLRRLAAFGSIAIWTFVFILYLEHAPTQLACPLSASFALGAALGLFRLSELRNNDNG